MTSAEQPRNILLPIDGSDHSKRAFEWYMKEMRKPVDTIIFVHVIEPNYDSKITTFNIYEALTIPDLGTTMHHNISVGKDICKAFVSLAKKESIECEAILHVGTKPGQSIIESGNKHNADVIIIGSRGIGSLQRTIRGSVSDYIIHHAKVPVTVIPPIA